MAQGRSGVMLFGRLFVYYVYASQLLTQLSLDVVIPLHIHPDQRTSADKSRSCEALPPSCRSKHQPFRHEMPKRNHESPDSEFKDGLGVDVVRSIQSNNRSDGGPCSKGTGGKWCDG